MKLPRRFLTILAFAFLATEAASAATTWTVNSTADTDDGACTNTTCTLRDAIKAAQNGDTIAFSSLFSTPQTISLASVLPDIATAITMTGPGANLLTVRRDYNAATNFGIFNIPPGVSQVTITGMTITGGRASSGAGGISCNSPLILTNVNVTGNQGNVGGGVNLDFANGTFSNCTFSGNTAGAQGGGIEFESDAAHTLTLRSSTVSGNKVNAGGPGGGIFHGSGNAHGTLALVGCTIVNNSSANGGGIYTVSGGSTANRATTTLRNTIIAYNTSTNLVTATFSGATATVTSNGFNLSDNYNGVATLATDVTGDPKLGPLSLNGGTTPTHALLGGSPALDAGNASGLASDQRGVPRVFGAAADIGAVEMQSIIVSNTNDSGVGSLRQAITDANNNGAGLDDIIFSNGVIGTINLESALPDITSSLTINGPGANLLTVQRDSNAATNFRVFNIPGGGLNVAFSGLTISNGLVNQSGGGIQSFSNLVLTNVYVTANQITGIGSGGGGVNLDGADGVFTSCTFSGNTAGGSFPFGGGIRFSGSISHRLRLVNSTVSGNSASGNSATTGGYGGGIFHVSGSGDSYLEVVNTTIANNSAQNGGGAFMEGDSMRFSFSTTTFRNSIIANNTADNLTKGDMGFVISQGFNLANDNGGGLLNVATDKINANAGLGPLAFNGGPTPTHALMFNSAALDAGNNSGSGTLFDQRGPGFPRTTDYSNIPNANGGDGTDIGAVEGTALTITAISHQTNGHTLLQGFGAPNLTYTVEASPDLSPGSFVALPTTVTADGTGALQYDDATAVGLTKRFYRLRFP